jgi:hypothetical protein
MESMLPSEGTRAKLDRLSSELRREFSHLPAAWVEQTLERVADDLLARARFQDFVPLLVHRRAREQLRAAVASAEPPSERAVREPVEAVAS